MKKSSVPSIREIAAKHGLKMPSPAQQEENLHHNLNLLPIYANRATTFIGGTPVQPGVKNVEVKAK